MDNFAPKLVNRASRLSGRRRSLFPRGNKTAGARRLLVLPLVPLGALLLLSLPLVGACDPCPVGPFGLPFNCGGSSDLDGDGVPELDDCDDADPERFPGNEELGCDGVDQDCNGSDDVREIPYDGLDQDCNGEDLVDVDNDGHDAVEAGGDDCDDDNNDVHPGETDIPYDGLDQDCDGEDLVDVDGDGFVGEEAGGDDCFDQDANVFPGAEELCDFGDNDCNGQVDDADLDGDGYAVCDDCDDTNATVHPGADEIIADGMDQDCNGADIGNCPEMLIAGNYDLHATLSLDECQNPGTVGVDIWEFGYELPASAICNFETLRIDWVDSISLGTPPYTTTITGDFWGTYLASGLGVSEGHFEGTAYDALAGSCQDVWGGISLQQ